MGTGRLFHWQQSSWARKLSTHLHPVLRARMVEEYLLPIVFTVWFLTNKHKDFCLDFLLNNFFGMVYFLHSIPFILCKM
jgi:hypothetical protein